MKIEIEFKIIARNDDFVNFKNLKALNYILINTIKSKIPN